MRAEGVEAGDDSADGWLHIPVPPGVDPEVLDVVTVPAGLWARASGGMAPATDDPAFTARPHPDGMMTLIVGAPGEPAPGAEQIAGLLAALPPRWRDNVVVARYGGDPQDCSCLPRQLAEGTGREVIALHGLLLAGADGRHRVTAVDVTRGAWWHPFAEQAAYSPTGSSRLMCWNDPAPDLEQLGAGGYRLVDEWFVQVIPAGLVLRRAGRPVEPAADAAPFDPSWLDLVIDHPVPELTDGVLTALSRLADALPGSARVRLRVVLPDGTADAEARRLRWAVPAPQHRRSRPAVADDEDGWSAAQPPDQRPPERSLDPDHPNPSRAPATLLVVTAQGRMCLI